MLAQFEQASLDNGAVDLTKLADDSTCRVTSLRGDPSDAGEECEAGIECVASGDDEVSSESVASEESEACNECVASGDEEACDECVAGEGDKAGDTCVASGDNEAARCPGRGESLFGPGIRNYLPDRCRTAMRDIVIPVRVYNRLPRVGLRGHRRPPDYCAA